MEKKFIADLKVNEQVDSSFILNKKNLKLTKYDKPYLEMTLSDKTGKIEGRLWDDAEKFNGYVETGDVVQVKGVVDKFKEEKQLKVDVIQRADDRAYRYEDMVRVVDNADKIYADINEMLKKVQNPWISQLIDQYIGDEYLMQAFKKGVGGKSWHNAYIGGLMEHTFEVMYISAKVCKLYPEADPDIVVFGAFIHDLGKVEELNEKTLEYTVAGGLLGHIAIGYKVLMRKIDNIPDFPEELSLRLEHGILSHHGEYIQQSPVLPKTLESTIVYQTDDLVSQANAVKELSSLQAAEGKLWSNYVSIKSRKYFIKNTQEEEWKQSQAQNKQRNEDLFG